ncbi:hypothetical protein Moror_11938 [Moniliophthora roreri MCA 2997]|nr:hypothetical protein Moror_11938 [Moniliophthora roreri MCA 2997]KAI3615705.1 hypothetical protein WG66_011931 [Moniliophthora roreri]
MAYSLSPSLKGWHARALETPYTDPFAPAAENLVFVALQNTPVTPEGFTLAIFKQETDNKNIIVDAQGRTLLLSENDYSGLVTIALKTLDLPPTGNFRNMWVVDQPTTSQPIDRLLVKDPDSGKLKQTSVQGWSETRRTLRQPVGDYTELPQVLVDLVGLVREAREGFVPGLGKPDPEMVTKVKAILPDDIE